MPSVEELLSQTSEEVEAYADTGIEYCTVDDDTRLVTIPDKYKKLGVESDERAKRIWFRFPKLVGNNGVDLSAIGVRVNFRNANGDGDIYIVEDLTTDGDYVIFSWELTRKVTAYKGNVSFVVCAVKSVMGGTIKNEWNTTLNKECEVLEGLEVTEQIEQENPDIIEYILAKLDGSISSEEVEQIIEAYMEKNPPSGMTDEERKQLQKNTEDISELSKDINNLKQNTPSSESVLTIAQVEALDNMFKKCAFTGDVTAEYIAFKTAFGIGNGGTEEPDTPVEPDEPTTPTLTSITATYTGGDVTEGTALTDLTGITVTGTYSDGSTANITGYTLSGEIVEGENTITVSYGGKTTTFKVTGIAESGGDTDVLYGKYWQPSPYQPWTASNLEGTGYVYTENTGTYVDAGLPPASSAKVNEPLQGHIYVRTLTKSQYAIDTAYQVYVNADGKVSTGGFEKLTHTRHDKFNGVAETIDVNGTTYYFTMYEWVIPSDKVGIFVSKADPMNNGQFISTNKLSIDEEYKQYYTLFTSDPTDRITEGATEVNA